MSLGIYGTWISPQGEVFIVKDLCSHSLMLDYGVAKDEGWIATVEHWTDDIRSKFFCVRYNRETVTRAALRVALKRFKDYPDEDYSLLAEGICQKPIYFGMGIPVSKRQGINFLQQELNKLTKGD